MKTSNVKGGKPPAWVGATGFVFVTATVVPIIVGVWIGSHVNHETIGGSVGAVVGFAFGVWVAIRPAWKDADREDRYTHDECQPRECDEGNDRVEQS